MMESKYMISTFLVYSYVFVVFYMMIIASELIRKASNLMKKLLLSALALFTLSTLIFVAYNHDWIITPDGRFIFVGLGTFLFGPLIGAVLVISNVLLSMAFSYESLPILVAITLVHYIIYFMLSRLIDRYSYVGRILMGLGALAITTIFSAVFVGLIGEGATDISNVSPLWVLTSFALKALLLITVGMTSIREKHRTRTIDELKTTKEAVMAKNINVRQLNNELIQSEQLLAKANAELESKVAIRTKELKELNVGLEAEIAERRKVESVLKKTQEQAVRASKIKSEFLANMSHEIRTPINAIMGFNYLLGNTDLSYQQQTYLKKANDSSEHLLNIINDILDFSKIEADQMSLHYSKVSLYKIINNVFDNVMYQVYKKDLTMIFNMDSHLPEYGYLDGNKLHQIMLNLLSNAVKFTDSGSITLSMKNLKVEDERCLIGIAIEDTGIGISEKYQKSLFDAFSQVEGKINRRYGGTGLGLSISKSLVELMGGQINVESRLGKGSTFTFTIWIDRVIYEPNYVIPGKPKIALVHGLRHSKNLLSRQLIKLGCDVRVFTMEEFEPSPVYKHNFDKIFIECDDPEEFDLERLDAIAEALECRERLFFVSHYRISRLQQITQRGLLKDVLQNPIGTADLYHLLMDKSEVEQLGTIPAYESQYKNVKILLVEDNPLNQLVCMEILQEKGVDVMVAADGAEAIELVGSETFDIILMDIHMPVMDGLEATRRIREIDSLKEIPIIAMTADAMSENEQSIYEAGLSDIILKPIDVKSMFEKLESYL